MSTFEDPNYLQPADEQPVHSFIDTLWSQSQDEAFANLIRKAAVAADVMTSIARVDTSEVYRPGHLSSLLANRVALSPVFYNSPKRPAKGTLLSEGGLMSRRGGGVSPTSPLAELVTHPFMESPFCVVHDDKGKRATVVNTHSPVSLFSTEHDAFTLANSEHSNHVNEVEPLPWTGTVYFIGNAVQRIYFPCGIELPSAYRKRDGLSLVVNNEPSLSGHNKNNNPVMAAWYANTGNGTQPSVPAAVPIRDNGVSVDHLFVSLKGVSFATVAHARDLVMTNRLAAVIEVGNVGTANRIQGLIPTLNLLNQRKELVLASNDAARAAMAAGIELHHSKLMSYHTGTQIGARGGVYQATADAIVGAVASVFASNVASSAIQFEGTTFSSEAVSAYDASLMRDVLDAYQNEVYQHFSDPNSNSLGQLISVVSLFDTIIRAPFLSDDFNKAIKAQGIAALAACMFRYDVFRSKATLRLDTMSLIADLSSSGSSSNLGTIVDEYVNRADSIYDRIAKTVDEFRSATTIEDIVTAIQRFHALTLPTLAMVEEALSHHVGGSPHSETAEPTVIEARLRGRQPSFSTIFNRLSFGPSHYDNNRHPDPMTSVLGQSSQFDDMVNSYMQIMLSNDALIDAIEEATEALQGYSPDEVADSFKLFILPIDDTEAFTFGEGDVDVSAKDSAEATSALQGAQGSNMSAGDQPGQFHVKPTTADKDSSLVSRVIARELSAIQELHAPHWVSQETQGTIDMQSWLNRGVGDVEIFRQWSETDHWRPRVEIVVAADVSGSMGSYAHSLGQAFYAIAKAGKEIDAPTSCLLFNTEHHLHYDSEDPNSIDLTVPHDVSSHGGTNPLTTLYNIANGERRAEKRVVVILTDGEWFGVEDGEYRKVVDILNRSNDTSLGVMYFGSSGNFTHIGTTLNSYGFRSSQITLSTQLQDLVRLTKTLVSQFL